MRGHNNLKKNFNLNIYQERSFQTSSKILDSKILGEGNYQTSPENFNSKILEEGNYQTSPENFNPRSTEERFQTSLINSIPVDCEEGSTKSY